MKKNKLKSKTQISFELEWITEIKKGKPWYSKSETSIFALLILASIDLAGFIQGAFKFDEFDLSKFQIGSIADEVVGIFGLIIMVMGFLVAFEVATIYMAYAFSLKLYNYDRYAIKRIKSKNDSAKISKFISTSILGWISLVAFILGVILNAIYRIGIISETTFFKENTYLINSEWALTIVMIVLPIITSIMNFVIGCFTFDPILFELNHLAKQIAVITSKIENIEREQKNTSDRIENFDILKDNALDNCNNAIRSATGLRTTLRTRIYEEEMRNI